MTERVRDDDFSNEEVRRLFAATLEVARASSDLDFAPFLEKIEQIVATATESDTTSIDLAGSDSPCRDEDGLATAVVPLEASDRRIGTLRLARGATRPFAAGDLRGATLLAAVVAVHIENARMRGHHLEQARELVDAGQLISASLELEETVQATAAALRQALGASNTFVLLVDDEGQELCCVTSSADEWRDFARSVRISVDATTTSIAARAFRSRTPIVVDDTADTSEMSIEMAELLGEKSVLALPLLLGDRAIGAVVIDDTQRTFRWKQGDIDRAEVLTRHASVAIAHARLFEEVRRRWRELERDQEELVERKRLTALGQLAATLAHEVRNPLGVLFNAIGTLGKELPATSDAATLLAIMDEEARRLERLVRELLDFARPIAPTLENESLAVVISGAIDAAATDLPVPAAKISWEIADGVPLIPLDPFMIRRALVNLLVNAAQAAGESGVVLVRASLERTPRGRAARIEIIDTGPGILPEHADRVFEPFFTTKATGTGLGLAVVKSIVEGHRGEIKLSSTAGVGTIATVMLPIDRTQDDESAALRPAW